MNNKFRKLEAEKREGTGPSKRLRSLLTPAEDDKRSFAGSLKKALAALGGSSRVRKPTPKSSEDASTKSEKGIFPTDEKIQCMPPDTCCCQNEVLVSRPSDKTLKVARPDLSDGCPYSFSDDNSLANITLIDERLEIDPDATSYQSMNNISKRHSTPSAELINAQFDTEECEENDDYSEWSFNHDDSEDAKQIIMKEINEEAK